MLCSGALSPCLHQTGKQKLRENCEACLGKTANVPAEPWEAVLLPPKSLQVLPEVYQLLLLWHD